MQPDPCLQYFIVSVISYGTLPYATGHLLPFGLLGMHSSSWFVWQSGTELRVLA